MDGRTYWAIIAIDEDINAVSNELANEPWLKLTNINNRMSKWKCESLIDVENAGSTGGVIIGIRFDWMKPSHRKQIINMQMIITRKTFPLIGQIDIVSMTQFYCKLRQLWNLLSRYENRVMLPNWIWHIGNGVEWRVLLTKIIYSQDFHKIFTRFSFDVHQSENGVKKVCANTWKLLQNG